MPDELLVLRYETDGLPAKDLSNILVALDDAFGRFARETSRGPRNHLLVTTIRRGSLEVVLDALSAAQDVMAARQYLAPFASHLADIVHHLLGGQSKLPSAADAKAVKSIVSPVANGNAVQVNLIVNGNVTFGADSRLASQVLSTLDLETRANQALPTPHPKALTVDLIDRRQVSDLRRGDLMGTAKNVDGEWYARLLDMRGVLVPIETEDVVSALLQHDRMYAFKGRPLHGNRGEIVGISLEGATALGGLS